MLEIVRLPERMSASLGPTVWMFPMMSQYRSQRFLFTFGSFQAPRSPPIQRRFFLWITSALQQAADVDSGASLALIHKAAVAAAHYLHFNKC